MTNRKYYSLRKGKGVTLPNLRVLLKSIYVSFCQKGYFQESLGYSCIDQGEVDGSLGPDIENYFLKTLRKDGLWPILTNYYLYDEEDIFDVIEILYDLVSMPIETEGAYHAFSSCGWHYIKFNKVPGRKEFRDEINELLKDYHAGYELLENGEIVKKTELGMTELMETEIPNTQDRKNINEKIELAKNKYRSRDSSAEDRRDAVRDLVDVLEFIKPDAAKVISKKDDTDLFNIANNFAIRHHNINQKSDYSRSVWLSWTFYAVLATIHAELRLINEYKKEEG